MTGNFVGHRGDPLARRLRVNRSAWPPALRDGAPASVYSAAAARRRRLARRARTARSAQERRYTVAFANLTEEPGVTLEGTGFTGREVRESFALAARRLADRARLLRQPARRCAGARQCRGRHRQEGGPLHPVPPGSATNAAIVEKLKARRHPGHRAELRRVPGRRSTRWTTWPPAGWPGKRSARFAARNWRAPDQGRRRAGAARRSGRGRPRAGAGRDGGAQATAACTRAGDRSTPRAIRRRSEPSSASSWPPSRTAKMLVAATDDQPRSPQRPRSSRPGGFRTAPS